MNDDERASVILDLKRLHAIVRAATLEAEMIESDKGIVAIERAGLIIMFETRMRSIADAIRRITQGKDDEP